MVVWVYLFEALKEEKGTCINHNYFTHAKISQRVGTQSPSESNTGRLKGGRSEGESEIGEGRGESINITPADWT